MAFPLVNKRQGSETRPGLHQFGLILLIDAWDAIVLSNKERRLIHSRWQSDGILNAIG